MGQDVYINDVQPQLAIPLTTELKLPFYDTLSKHIDFDCFVICVPNGDHQAFIKRAVMLNANMFVEKPISHRVGEIPDLLKEAKAKGLFVMTGYQFRFHPALNALKEKLQGQKIISIRAEFGQYLPDWRAGDYIDYYSCWDDLGGGILLDASHELDYVEWLSGGRIKQVACFCGKRSSLLGDSEDVAEVNLRMDNGVIANVHMDYLQRNYNRWCQVITDTGEYRWQFDRLTDNFDMYRFEMAHLVNCLEKKETPIVTGEQGLHILEVVNSAKRSSGLSKIEEL